MIYIPHPGLNNKKLSALKNSLLIGFTHLSSSQSPRKKISKQAHLKPHPLKQKDKHIIPSSNLQSHALLQTYGAILPTSLTYVILFNQRFLTLETCCGYWYGRLWKTVIYALWFSWFNRNAPRAFSKTSAGKYLFISDLVSNWFISEVFCPRLTRPVQSHENKLKRKDNFSQSYD